MLSKNSPLDSQRYFGKKIFVKGFLFFLMWTSFKVFIKFVIILLLFYVLIFGQEACKTLTPHPGINPPPLTLESEVLLTTGPPGNSLGGEILMNPDSCIFPYT